MSPVRVLVTGGAGYVGSHVAWALLDAGIDVVVLDDLSTGLPSLVPPGARFVRGAVGDRGLLDNILGEDIAAVIHMAAASLVGESVEQPAKYYRANVADSMVLLDACRTARVRRFLFSSSASVYGVPASVPVDEGAPLEPVNPYGATKLAFERILADVAARSGMSHVALRYFNVAGADPQGRTGESTASATHLIKAVCQHIAGRRDELVLFGTGYPTPDGTCVRDYVHAADVAAAHVSALRYLLQGGQSMAFNIGYGRGSSVREVLAAAERVAGHPLKVRVAGPRPGDPPVLVAETARARAVLGWVPQHEGLAGMIESALAWERRLAV